jgi:integrase
VKVLTAHRKCQAGERLLAGSSWVDNALVVANRIGTPVSPGNFDQTLDRLVAAAGVPRLSSHGLRRTAATHMVRSASDLGEIRAAADLLGHSPDMLMRTYAKVLLETISAVTEKIGARARELPRTRFFSQMRGFSHL